MSSSSLGGIITLAEDLSITRMGYGAMQLAGPKVFGPPRDPSHAKAVLREVVERGITHIDTSDFYGPFVVNNLIKEALAPYHKNLHIVTKVGAMRGEDASWRPALSAVDLTEAVHSNLKHLGLDVLDVVNLRVGDPISSPDQSIAEPFEVLNGLKREGLIRHLGISNVTIANLRQAQKVAPVVCVQNLYNIAHREDDELVDICAKEGIAFIPYFPLGGFTPLQSGTLDGVATRLGANSQQVALAWLLQRSPAIALIPGTSSLEHLDENISSVDLHLPSDALIDLDQIASK
jgi:pyridoxine 4-dehydrogenase